MDFSEVGPWTARRDGEEKLLTVLLGAAPRYQVVLDDVQYVIPEGTDPYWEDFGDDIGWSLLPKGEHPQWRGRGMRPHAPEREKEPGWEIPPRLTWPPPEVPAKPRAPLAHWKTVGDLRRALRTAHAEPHALRAPRPTADLGELHDDLGTASALIEELKLFLPEAIDRLEHAHGVRALAAIKRASVRLLGAVDNYALAVDNFRGWVDGQFAKAHRRFLDSLLTGAKVPRYTRAGGDIPGARLFVHAADHIVRTPIAFAVAAPTETERHPGDRAHNPMIGGLGALNARVLAMVEALEPDHRFVHDLLESKRAEKLALNYWRAAITNYRKNKEPAVPHEPLPVFDGDVAPIEKRVRPPEHVPKRPQPGPSYR